jgi:hypothetical protein
MFDGGMPGEDPNYGWNRASIQYRSRKFCKPCIKAEDLVLRSGLGNFRMLKLCVAMGLMMTVLYVWVTVFIVNVFIPLTGPMYAALMGGAVALFTVSLYVFGTRETKRDRELAERL